MKLLIDYGVLLSRYIYEIKPPYYFRLEYTITLSITEVDASLLRCSNPTILQYEFEIYSSIKS